MKLKIGLLFIVLVLIVTTIYGIRRFVVTKPDGTIDTANLENIINDIYDTFQTKKFNKFTTVPEINQIVGDCSSEMINPKPKTFEFNPESIIDRSHSCLDRILNDNMRSDINNRGERNAFRLKTILKQTHY